MAWRAEYSKGNPVRAKRLESITELLFDSARSGKLEKEIQTVVPMMIEIKENTLNLTPITVAFEPFRRTGNKKMRYYGMCLSYMLNVEGVFDETIRLLYLLASSAKGKSITLAEINKQPLSQIRAEFSRVYLPDVFFDGWEDGRVRNSIAHCRFRYEAKTGKMRFQDMDYSGRKPPYDQSFTVEDFSRLALDLSDVYYNVQNAIFMLRIIHLALAPIVPRVGRDLLM